MNFKTNNTTPRDRKIAVWLKEISKLDETIAHEMFAHKSKIVGPLYTALEEDFAIFDLKKRVGIAQLEIVGTEKLLKEHKSELESALKKLKQDEKCELVFLTCVDLEKAQGLILAVDEETKVLLSRVLSVQFTNGLAIRKGVLMRKEIVPLIKEAFEN